MSTLGSIFKGIHSLQEFSLKRIIPGQFSFNVKENQIFERIYRHSLHFFSGESIADLNRNSRHRIGESETDQHCLEWNLNQKYSDIATRDLLIIFNRITPYFFRKIIATVSQYLHFYFLTDCDTETNLQDSCNQLNIFVLFNNRFITYMRPCSMKETNEDGFRQFYNRWEKIFKSYFHLLKNKLKTGKIQPGRKFVIPLLAFHFSELHPRISMPCPFKLKTELLFHKRI